MGGDEDLATSSSRPTVLVVGFDLRPESGAALAVAADLAERLAARLCVVHAAGLSDYPIDPDRWDWEDEARRVLALERAEVTATLASRAQPWSYEARYGSAAQVLASAADDYDALMIVVGSRGEGWRHLLDHLLEPSVSHEIIGHRDRPVLVVTHRPPPTPPTPGPGGG